MSTILGWYYLHDNKQLIFKNNPDAIDDIRESDLCHSAWPWDSSREAAWRILVEGLSLDASLKKVKELYETWRFTDEDAKIYADRLGIELGEDGSSKTAKMPNFINLQESHCGFGDSYLEAMADLCKQLGFKGGKMWNATFADLCKNELTVS